MSQPTQPHQASSSSHSSSQSPQYAQQQGLGLYAPPSLSGAYTQAPVALTLHLKIPSMFSNRSRVWVCMFPRL